MKALKLIAMMMITKHYPPQGYKNAYYKNDPNYKDRKKKGFFGDFFDFD